MFHIGRSGSTVLSDLLNQHRKLFWDGEIYRKIITKWEKYGDVTVAKGISEDPVEFLQKRMNRAGQKFYGFEVKFFHLKLTKTNLSDYINHLHSLEFSHYIILERKNYLRKIVSSIIARERSQSHQTADEKPLLHQIEIDVSNVEIDRDAKPMIEYLIDYQECFRLLNKLLTGKRVLKLTYEDDILSDPLKGYNLVCNFINIRPQNVSVRFGKTNPFKLHEMIYNIGEVERSLSGTPFEWMLND